MFHHRHCTVLQLPLHPFCKNKCTFWLKKGILTNGKLCIIIIIIIIIGFWLTCRCRIIFHIVGPSPSNRLAAHTADLTLGKMAICIFASKFNGRMLFLSPTQTLSAVQELRLYPTDLGCVLHCWHHDLVVLYRWTTATAPRSPSVDSRCEATSRRLWKG